MTVDPTPTGCRLTQQEEAEVTSALLDAFEPAPTKLLELSRYLNSICALPECPSLGSELKAFQRERVTRKLIGELQSWLDAIRAHVEARTLRTT